MNCQKLVNLSSWCALTVLLASCASSVDSFSASPESQVTYMESEEKRSEVTEESGASIAQIGSLSSELSTPQIDPPNMEEKPLTVSQLQTYKDRCLDESELPPSNLDCSELKLRIERSYRNDNEVRDALITLNRLGRNDMRTVQDDLKKGETRFSLESQAIAGGLIDPPLPQQPQEDENVLDVLEQNGISFDPTTIVAQK